MFVMLDALCALHHVQRIMEGAKKGWILLGDPRAPRGVWLRLRDTSFLPRLELASAWPRAIRLSLDGQPLFWARVWADHGGWTLLPNRPMPRVIPSFDTAEMRGRSTWWAWLERMVPFVEALCGTRGNIHLLGGSRPLDPWWGFEGGDNAWYAAPLPSRPWPAPEDGRVKAYRKLLREGIAPPPLLLWNSGLHAHLVLDGHARIVAAALEHIRLPSLSILEVREEAAVTPHPRLEAGLAPLLASSDPQVANHALETLTAASAPTWRAISRATPMDLATWRHEVKQRLRSLARGRQKTLSRELLAP